MTVEDLHSFGDTDN